MDTYKQERVGDWIQTYTGKRFYPLDPRKEDICIEDVAHSLSNLCRFTGHGERFYSVAEHSVHCCAVAKDNGLTNLQTLYCLLHDASESIVNDVARPVKQNLHDYKETEDKIMSVMWEAFGLPQPSKEDYEVVKLVDNTLLIHEIKQLMKRREDLPNVETLDSYVYLGQSPSNKEVKETFLWLFNNLMNKYKEELGE